MCHIGPNKDRGKEEGGKLRPNAFVTADLLSRSHSLVSSSRPSEKRKITVVVSEEEEEKAGKFLYSGGAVVRRPRRRQGWPRGARTSASRSQRLRPAAGHAVNWEGVYECSELITLHC